MTNGTRGEKITTYLFSKGSMINYQKNYYINMSSILQIEEMRVQ